MDGLSELLESAEHTDASTRLRVGGFDLITDEPFEPLDVMGERLVRKAQERRRRQQALSGFSGDPLSQMLAGSQDSMRQELLRIRTQNAMEATSSVPAVVREPFRAAGRVGASIMSTATRPFSKELADYFADERQRIGIADDSIRKGDWSPWLSRIYGGATESVLQSTLASPAGPYGIVGSFAVTEANEALRDAENAGLEGNQRLAYAAVQGAIEGSVAALFQRFGMGGQERLIGEISRGVMKTSGKEFLRTMAEEIPEEIITEVLHQTAEGISGVNPRAFEPEELKTRLTDTIAQTVMAVGMGQTTQMAMRLEQLHDARKKGFVTEQDAADLGLTEEESKNRKSRQDAVDKRIAELEQIIADAEKEDPTSEQAAREQLQDSEEAIDAEPVDQERLAAPASGAAEGLTAQSPDTTAPVGDAPAADESVSPDSPASPQTPAQEPPPSGPPPAVPAPQEATQGPESPFVAMTAKELRSEAKRLGLKGYSGRKKHVLRKMVEDAQAQQPAHTEQTPEKGPLSPSVKFDSTLVSPEYLSRLRQESPEELQKLRISIVAERDKQMDLAKMSDAPELQSLAKREVAEFNEKIRLIDVLLKSGASQEEEASVAPDSSEPHHTRPFPELDTIAAGLKVDDRIIEETRSEMERESGQSVTSEQAVVELAEEDLYTLFSNAESLARRLHKARDKYWDRIFPDPDQFNEWVSRQEDEFSDEDYIIDLFQRHMIRALNDRFGTTMPEVRDATTGFSDIEGSVSPPATRRGVSDVSSSSPSGEAGSPVLKSDVIQAVKRLWPGLSVRGKATNLPRRRTGWYNNFLAEMRLVDARDIDTALHELGHHFDREMGKWSMSTDASAEIQGELVALGKSLYGSRPPAVGYKSEGFAEFIRLYISGDPDLGTMSPSLYTWFTTEYLTGRPAEARKVRELELLVASRLAQGPRSNVRAFRSPVREDWSVERLAASVASLEASHVDRNLPILRAMQRAGVDQSSVRPGENPYTLATVYSRSAGARTIHAVLNNTADLSGSNTGVSLKEALRPISEQGDEAIEDWKDYAVARRALDLLDRGIQAGITRADAIRVIDDLDSQVMRDVTDAVTEWSGRQLELLVEAGVMTGAELADIRDANPVYVPFARQFLDGEKKQRGGDGTGRGVYTIRGDGREIHDPLEMLIVQAEQIAAAAMRADVVRSLVNIAQARAADGRSPAHPYLGQILSEVPAPTEATTFSMSQIQNEVQAKAVELGADPLEVMAASMDAFDDMLTVYTKGRTYNGTDNIYSHVVNGERRFFEINDKGIVDAIEDVTRDRFLGGQLGEISRRAVALQRLGATGLNPAFGLIRNALRDTLTASITADYHFHIPILSTLAGTVQDIMGTEASQTYHALGLDLAGRIGQDRRTQRNMGRRATATTAASSFVRGGIVSGVRDILSKSEIGPRLMEFEGARRYGEQQEGWTDRDVNMLAAAASKDITVNFSRAGSTGVRANEVILFYNAAVQSVNKLGRSLGLFEPLPTQRNQTRLGNAQKTLARGAILTAVAMLAYSRNRDDDEWKRLPAYEKWNYLHFRIEGNMIRIPLPFEAGALFGALPVAMVDGSLDEALDEAGKNVMPVKMDGDNARERFHSIASNIAAISPLADVVANRDWKGDTIVSENLQRSRSEEDQYGPYTTEFSKALADTFPGTISPAQLDHLLTGYTGGLYRRLATALEPDTYRDIGADGDLSTLPVAGTLFVRRNQSRVPREFYEDLERLRQKRGSGTASLEEIGRLSEGDRLNRSLTGLWSQRREAGKTEAEQTMAEILRRMEEHIDRDDFAAVGAQNVMLAATDPQATDAEKQQAVGLLRGQNVMPILKKAAQARGYSTKVYTSGRKLTPFGRRVMAARRLFARQAP